jgi:hypothetical protein
MSDISSAGERQCVSCRDTEETARLEKCSVCFKFFCPDCAHRALGRRFCSAHCAHEYFYGETDDDETVDPDAG